MNKWIIGFLTGLITFIGVLWFFKSKRAEEEELNYVYGDSLYRDGEDLSSVAQPDDESEAEEEKEEIAGEKLEKPPYSALVH